MLINLFIFILICYGMTQIICYGKIFDKIRPNIYLFKCSMCMGFYVGFFVYLLTFQASFLILFSVFNMPDAFLLSCLSSGTSYILDKLIGDKGLNINNDNRTK